MLIFFNFIRVFVFTTNHHLNMPISVGILTIMSRKIAYPKKNEFIDIFILSAIKLPCSYRGEPGLVDRVLAWHAGSSTPTGGTCPNDFSDPIDQDIRTQ